jgi:hypothetical protein
LFTSAASAEMFAPPDDDAELAGAELALEPELALELELELELLDEHAASRTAAPTAVIANATRAARGLCLPCLPSSLRFMRPRIYHTGSDQTSLVPQT